MRKEELLNKFNKMYTNLTLETDSKEIYNEKDKVTVKCLQCFHSWPSSIKNVLVFRSGCYKCCKGKGLAWTR